MKRWAFAWWWGMAVLLAATGGADVRNCTTAMVTSGLCQAATDALLFYPIPEAAQADFIDAWAERANYQEQVPCGVEPLTDDAGIVVQAGPGDSTCTAGNVGEVVANPQPKARAVDRYIRSVLVAAVRAYRAQRAEAAAREAAEQEPEPGIP